MSCCGKRHSRSGNRSKHGYRGLRTLLFGMLAGVIVGLLLAPKTGTETMSACRDMLLRKMPV